MTLYDILFYMSHQLWNSFKYGFFTNIVKMPYSFLE